MFFAAPIVATFVPNPQWQHRLQKFPPMNGGLAVQSTVGLNRLAVGPWAGPGMGGAYDVAALAVGTAVFLPRHA